MSSSQVRDIGMECKVISLILTAMKRNSKNTALLILNTLGPEEIPVETKRVVDLRRLSTPVIAPTPKTLNTLP